MTQDNPGDLPAPITPTPANDKALALEAEDRALALKAVDEAFVDLQVAKPLVESKLRQLGPEIDPDPYPLFRTVLQSLWKFLEAVSLIRSEGDFNQASTLFQDSAQGFGNVRLNELRDLCVGMGVYTVAVVQLQVMNLSQALDLLAKVKDYLRSAGQYGSMFEPFIDHMEPDALFVGGVRAFMSYDFANAKALIDRASQSSEKVARTYYKEGEPLFNTFLGISHFHKAYYTFVHVMNEFSFFDYDKISIEKDLAQDARQARDLMDQGDLGSVGFRNIRYLSDALVELLEMIGELSAMMVTVFHSTFKPDLRTLTQLRQKVRKASDSISQAGPQAVALIRYCDQLSDQINNLERLARPSKKDFGAYSGLIACGLFLPLFLIVSWANASFHIELKASELISSCLVLALIGGFGFGALRFKSLIFPGSAPDEAKDAKGGS